MCFIYMCDPLHFLSSVFAVSSAFGESRFANGRVTHTGLASGLANLNEQSLPSSGDIGESASLRSGHIRDRSSLGCDIHLVLLPSY